MLTTLFLSTKYWL